MVLSSTWRTIEDETGACEDNNMIHDEENKASSPEEFLNISRKKGMLLLKSEQTFTMEILPLFKRYYASLRIR